MLKKIFIIWIILIQAIAMNAQVKQPQSWKDKIFFGGNFGLQFGTITDIEISPIVGYWIRPRIAAGVGVTYEYFHDKRFKPFEINTHIYGGRVFSRLVVIQDFNKMIPIGFTGSVFAHAEYEGLSLERKYFDYPTYGEGRFLLNSVLVGGGLSQPIGRKGAVYITILYNLNETMNTPYTNPIVRIGFSF